MRKFTMISKCGAVVSHSGFFGSSKESNVNRLPANHDPSAPWISFTASINAYALETGCVVDGFTPITAVLGGRCGSEVAPSIVKAISVTMVDSGLRASIKNLLMHRYVSWESVSETTAHCVPRAAAALSRPAKSDQSVELDHINDCFFSAGQWNGPIFNVVNRYDTTAQSSFGLTVATKKSERFSLFVSPVSVGPLGDFGLLAASTLTVTMLNSLKGLIRWFIHACILPSPVDTLEACYG